MTIKTTPAKRPALMADATVKTRRAANKADSEIDRKPGHFIRRLQQIANAIFMEETKLLRVTPIQVAIIMVLLSTPDIDQRTLSKAIDFDAATVGAVIERLEVRAVLRRYSLEHDRRAKLLVLTKKGITLAEKLKPHIGRTQNRLLAPLSDRDRKAFGKMLNVLVAFHSA